MYHAIPPCIIPCQADAYTIPTRIISYRRVPFHTDVYHTILYRRVSYHTVPTCTILDQRVPYHTIPIYTDHTDIYRPYRYIPTCITSYRRVLSYHTDEYHTYRRVYTDIPERERDGLEGKVVLEIGRLSLQHLDRGIIEVGAHCSVVRTAPRVRKCAGKIRVMNKKSDGGSMGEALTMDSRRLVEEGRVPLHGGRHRQKSSYDSRGVARQKSEDTNKTQATPPRLPKPTQSS